MATRSSILAWKIPWTEEPGRLQTMGLQEESQTQLSNENDNNKVRLQQDSTNGDTLKNENDATHITVKQEA